MRAVVRSLRLPRIPLPVIPVLVALSAACTQKTADTSDHPDTWSASIDVERDPRTFATGETVRVVASMTLRGPEKCDDAASGCNGPACSSPTMTPDVSVVSLECTPGATCAVVDAPERGAVAIDVRSDDARGVDGTLVLRSSEGQVATATFTVRFAKPTAIPVARPYPTTPEGDRAAVLPGTVLVRCPRLASDAGSLVFTASDLVSEVRGAARDVTRDAETGCVRFAASAPGAIVVSHAFRGLAHEERIAVVDPRDLVTHEIVEVSGHAREVRLLDVGDDPLLDAAPLGRVVATDCQGQATRLWASRLVARDGHVVLRMPEGLRVDPASLARVAPSDAPDVFLPSAFFTVHGAERGDGALVADAFASIPLTVDAPCGAPTDAGADAALDADPAP